MVYMSKSKRKRVMRKRLLAAGIVAAAVVAVFVSVWQVGLGGTAAKVNDVVIRSGTVEGVAPLTKMFTYLNYLGQLPPEDTIDSTLTGDEAAAAKQSAEDQKLIEYNTALTQICVPAEVLKQHFKSEEKTVLTDEIKKTIKTETDSMLANAEIKKWLTARGIKASNIAYYYEYQEHMSALYTEVQENQPVTDEDAKAYYDENKSMFETPLQLQASHILIEDPEHTAEKRAEIEAILERVKSGEDFAELAREYSEDGSAEAGGDLGTFGQGQMVAPFEEAALALEPDEVSDIVETEFGFHIIKLASKTEASVQTLEEARDTIDSYVLSERTQTELDALVAAANVVYTGELNPETGKPPVSTAELDAMRGTGDAAEEETAPAGDAETETENPPAAETPPATEGEGTGTETAAGTEDAAAGAEGTGTETVAGAGSEGADNQTPATN